MNDSDNIGTEPRRTLAALRKSRWPGWIWAVPLAAVAIVVWLLLRAFSARGIDVAVTFDDAAGMAPTDTKVQYRGVDVGKVRGVRLTPDGMHVVVNLDLAASMRGNLKSGTRFYLQGAHPSLSDPSTLKAIITGPTIVMVPGPGQPARRFTGITGNPREAFAFTIPYLVTFHGPGGSLRTGSPVTLYGFTVGEVTSVTLTTDAQTGQVTTPVIIALDPTRFRIRGATPVGGDWSGVMNETLAKLVQRGLRARLTLTPPLVGTQQIALDITPGTEAASLRMRGRYVEIPAIEGGGAESVLTRLDQIPIDQIANNVRVITERVKALVSSPQLAESIQHLNGTLTELDATLHSAGPQLTDTVSTARQTIESLRKTAIEIDATTGAAQRMMGASPASPEDSLPQALHELAEAARQIRTLADDLDQHPEVLIRGR